MAIGEARVLPRVQLAALVPWVETYRKTPTASETGGGLGDVNLAARLGAIAEAAERCGLL